MSEQAVKVKFLREIDIVFQDPDGSEEENAASLTACKCMNCHWEFIGDCHRFGYGFTSEGVQIPNYCPMCGSKFDDDLIE